MPGIDYDCAGCGRRHEGTDGSRAHPWPVIEFVRPEPCLRMDPWEFLRRVRSTEELCLIDDGRSVDCYLSGCLVLPVRGEDSLLVHRAWAQISQEDYLELGEHWGDPHYRSIFRGTLASMLPGHEDSLSVALSLEVTGTMIPQMVPTRRGGHAVAREAWDGISREEAELRIRTMLLDHPDL